MSDLARGFAYGVLLAFVVLITLAVATGVLSWR